MPLKPRSLPVFELSTSSTEAVLLTVRDLKVHFPVKGDGAWPWSPKLMLKAVDGVSFDLRAGQTLGIVGESGCGKSTLARAILNLIPATAGSIHFKGQEMAGASARAWQQLRRDVQMIFQDPLASLNPRMTVAQTIAEPLRTHMPDMPREQVHQRVLEIMEQVGLARHQINRYPHEFSGGQCQRIGIARALVLKPQLIICDEPVSALDVSIRAQIVNLLKDLQQSMGLSLIFIAHDLAVVKHISDRIVVMYLGKAVEIAPKQTLYTQPQHPYTRALLSAIPIPDPMLERQKKIQLLQGDLPSPLKPPSGCAFRTRCPQAQSVCAQQTPVLERSNTQSDVACLLAGKASASV
jgi:oligopeptide transport system ATP-binding protein